MTKKVVFNWSGGKDSALALYKILQKKGIEVVALLTTLEAPSLQSTIHAIPLKLLQQQAESIGIPLYPILLEKGKKTYKEQMKEAVEHFKKQGVSSFIFGDLYLEEVKKYREEHLHPQGIEVLAPLWGKKPMEVMEDFLTSGIQAKIIVTQADQLGKHFIGRTLDRDLLSALPKEIDICGENGEYHTFTYDGPLFQKRIDFHIKEVATITHEFKMDTGKFQKFSYWQAKLDM